MDRSHLHQSPHEPPQQRHHAAPVSTGSAGRRARASLHPRERECITTTRSRRPRAAALLACVIRPAHRVRIREFGDGVLDGSSVGFRHAPLYDRTNVCRCQAVGLSDHDQSGRPSRAAPVSCPLLRPVARLRAGWVPRRWMSPASGKEGHRSDSSTWSVVFVPRPTALTALQCDCRWRPCDGGCPLVRSSDHQILGLCSWRHRDRQLTGWDQLPGVSGHVTGSC